MPDEIARKDVQEGVTEKPPEKERICLCCGDPCLSWQIFCGAACSAIYESGTNEK